MWHHFQKTFYRWGLSYICISPWHKFSLRWSHSRILRRSRSWLSIFPHLCKSRRWWPHQVQSPLSQWNTVQSAIFYLRLVVQRGLFTVWKFLQFKRWYRSRAGRQFSRGWSGSARCRRRYHCFNNLLFTQLPIHSTKPGQSLFFTKLLDRDFLMECLILIPNRRPFRIIQKNRVELYVFIIIMNNYCWLF